MTGRLRFSDKSLLVPLILPALGTRVYWAYMTCKKLTNEEIVSISCAKRHLSMVLDDLMPTKRGIMQITYIDGPPIFADYSVAYAIQETPEGWTIFVPDGTFFTTLSCEESSILRSIFVCAAIVKLWTPFV